MRNHWLGRGIVAGLLASGTAWADRVMIEDFADAGTWRTCQYQNTMPGTWFAAQQCLSGFPDASREDGFTGKIQYNLKPGQPGMLGFLRAKAAQAEATADGIEFDANTSGTAVSIEFVLQDSKNKNFTTSSVKLSGNGWQHYRLPLNEKTVKNFNQIVQPVRLFRVSTGIDKGGKGELKLDDLLFTGVARADRRIQIVPVISQLVNPPEQPFKLVYRLRNAVMQERAGQLSIRVKDMNDREVFHGEQQVVLPAGGQTKGQFTVPGLPPGAYYAELALPAGADRANYTDWINVFTAEQGRSNHKAMWFGVQDTDIWNGEYERKLHRDWLKTLGADLVRFGITGNRLEYDGGNSWPDVKKLLDPLRDLDILVCFSYCEGTPSFLQDGKPDSRRLPDKMDGFARHAKQMFSFLKEYRNVRYFEWWNEPDLGFLNGNFEQYLACLKVLYKEAKAVNPEIMIGTGGVTVIHPREKKNFSHDMYVQGKGYYDVALFHAHGPLNNYVERQQKVEGWLTEAGNAAVPIANTETGERSGYNVDTIKNHAEVLVKKITYAKSRHTEFYTWFTLQDYWDMDFNADDSFGLVTSDNRPKPSFAAYRELIRQLADTGRGEALALDNMLTVYRFIAEAKNEEVMVCWPQLAKSQVALTLEGKGTVSVGDMFGKRREVAAGEGLITVAVPGAPTYIRYPRGAFKPIPALVIQSEPAAGAAGETVKTKLKIRNPFAETVEYQLMLNGKMTAVTVERNKDKTVELALQVPKARANGVSSVMLGVKLVTADRVTSLEQPLTVQAGYPCRQAGATPETLTVDNLAQVQEMTFDPTIPQWQGAQDLSARCTMQREGGNLAVTFVVTDDKHVMTSKPEEAWRDDSVQMGFVGNSGKCTILTISGKDDKVYVWCNNSGRKDLVGQWPVEGTFKREKQQSVYKFKLPLERLGIPARPGTAFRFSFLVNENDGLGRVRWIEWRGGIGRGMNPDEFGWGVLQ